MNETVPLPGDFYQCCLESSLLNSTIYLTGCDVTISVELVLALASGILLVYNIYSGLKFRLSYSLLTYFTCTQVRMAVTLANY